MKYLADLALACVLVLLLPVVLIALGAPVALLVRWVMGFAE